MHHYKQSTELCYLWDVTPGKPEAFKKKMSNLLIILQINDFAHLPLFLMLVFPLHCARLPVPCYCRILPDMLQHNMVQFREC
jgi:hypothetical protein